MPRTTYAYPFEWKVLNFAGDQSSRLTARENPQGFLMQFDEPGSVNRMEFGCPDEGWHVLKQACIDTGSAFLLFDPFDAPEYTWLEWQGIQRATMERLLGEAFEAPDFKKADVSTPAAPDLKPAGAFPDSWSVMF